MNYNMSTPGHDYVCDTYNLIAAVINDDRCKAETIISRCKLEDVLGVTMSMLAAVLKGAGERETNALARIGQDRAGQLHRSLVTA